MKKNLIVLMVLTLFLTFVIIPTQKANAIVHGSMAMKSVVIGALERGGVKFANKEAKDKAYDAWNMKAYEKWKSDEALGKNADLWSDFEKIKGSAVTVNPIDELPGFGRVLMDASFFGMAVAIGAEVGLEIENNAREGLRQHYWAEGYKPYEGATFDGVLGLHQVEEVKVNSRYRKNYAFSDGSGASFATSIYENDGGTFKHLTKVWTIETDKGYVWYTSITQNRNSDGKLVATEVDSRKQWDLPLDWKYELVPSPSDVPTRNIPDILKPLVEVPDISQVPSTMPSLEPVPIIVPLNDPFADNPHNTPYSVPGKEPAPGTGTEPKPDDGGGGGGGEKPPEKEEPKIKNPFLDKIPIALLLGLFKLLAAIIAYLARMFAFIVTIGLIQPTPIENPYFLWFIQAEFYGIKPFPVVRNLALFFLGFSIYKSIRRVFG